MELQSAYDTAVAGADHGKAAQVQPLLAAAREALLIAEATTAALRSAQETLDRQRADEARAAGQAQQREEAQRIIGDAIQADRRAQDGIAESLSTMYACLGAAQDAFRQALAWEDKAGAERQRIIQGRVMLGEMEAPGPRAPKPNAASVLADRDPAIRELMQWRR